MICRTFIPVFAVSLALMPAGCAMQTDVTLNPKYRHGWGPGDEFELRRPMALIHDTGSGKVYFEPDKQEVPLGTVVGGVDSHDQVLVEHAGRGTRFRVEKLIRLNGWPLAVTVTTAEGRMVNGSHKGSIVALFTISGQDWIAEEEIVQSRDDALVTPAR